MIRHCACCAGLYRAPYESEETSVLLDPYCDRCQVAYLEFKLGLLVAAYRHVVKKEPGPQTG